MQMMYITLQFAQLDQPVLSPQTNKPVYDVDMEACPEGLRDWCWSTLLKKAGIVSIIFHDLSRIQSFFEPQ